MPWSPTRQRRSATGMPDASAVSKSSPGHTSPSRHWTSTGRCARNADHSPLGWSQLVTPLSSSPSAAASSGVSSTTRRPPPSRGTRITIPRPSLVAPKGPPPVGGFTAAIECSPQMRAGPPARAWSAPSMPRHWISSHTRH